MLWRREPTGREIELPKWTWLKAAEREKRDGHIRELYAMGKTRQELAEMFDLTKVRIMQIVKDK
jgi:hypothetical protein